MSSQFDSMFQALAVPSILGVHGESVPYTKSGEAKANTLTLVITPRESRFVESAAGLVEVFRVHVSGETNDYAPSLGDRLIYGGKTWDYAGLAKDAAGGMAHAYFESVDWKHIGAVGVAPI